MDRSELPESLKASIKVGVIIVTHNSEKSIDQTLYALHQQTIPVAQEILVDSGSTSTHYIKKHGTGGPLEICLMPNMGFSAANNLGYASLEKDLPYVLFLNPDVILPKDFIEKALQWMEAPGREKVGAISGPLYGWNLTEEKPTGLIDSTGIFSTWYGHWYDRAKGWPARLNPYTRLEVVPALCGALLFCRTTALERTKLSPDQVFDETFFCYKEDIELSLRLRKNGWQLCYVPELVAYHARGWSGSRKEISRDTRLMSAENELRLHLRSFNPFKIAYSALKLIGVKMFNL